MSRSSTVLVDSLDRTSIVVLALELVVDNCSNPSNAIDQNSPVHVCGAGMRSGREEKQDPAARQENDGNQVNDETPFTQTESARQESLFHDSLPSHAANANDVRGQKSDAGQTEDDVESCAGANDDE
jgi:hypothetical protein